MSSSFHANTVLKAENYQVWIWGNAQWVQGPHDGGQKPAELSPHFLYHPPRCPGTTPQSSRHKTHGQGRLLVGLGLLQQLNPFQNRKGTEQLGRSRPSGCQSRAQSPLADTSSLTSTYGKRHRSQAGSWLLR